MQGGQTLTAAAPYERIPLFVRAGAIVPMGPRDAQHAGQTDGPIEVRVYPGASGRFDLYQDAGDGYGYEDGAFTTIPLIYNDRSGVLSIGASRGRYRGMPASRSFNVVFVGEDRGTGVDETRTCHFVLHTGDRRTVRAPAAPAAGPRPASCRVRN